MEVLDFEEDDLKPKIKRSDLPYDLTSQCHIELFDGHQCLFYKDIPMIIVSCEFWTEDIEVKADYIDYGEDEKGYALLVNVPRYENGQLANVDHVYYGLFKSFEEFAEWLAKPYYSYYGKGAGTFGTLY